MPHLAVVRITRHSNAQTRLRQPKGLEVTAILVLTAATSLSLSLVICRSGGPKGSAKAYLPENKQFLITRNVPSLRRAHTYALADAKEEVIRTDAADAGAMQDAEGWLSTHSQADMARNREVCDLDHDLNAKPAAAAAAASSSSASASAAKAASSSAAAAAAKAAAPAQDDDEIGDIDDMDADMSNLVVAPAAAKSAAAAASAPSAAAAAAEEFPDMEAVDDDDNVLAPPAPAKEAKADGSYLKAEEPEDNIVKT